jgi:SAM-dependent methyltransferase
VQATHSLTAGNKNNAVELIRGPLRMRLRWVSTVLAMHIPKLKGVIYRTRTLTQGRLDCFDVILPHVKAKRGLEIGGPSEIFRRSYSPLPIYRHIASLDNCDMSRTTVWATHSDDYDFSPGKTPGRTIVCDGSDLSSVADQRYDFILSSHNLEHFANPVKALREWKRVTRPGGSLILILPNYAKTFDHRRVPTTVKHMLEDYERNTQEDDLSHLPEILQAHDLSMDPAAGSAEQFRIRSLNNFTNRCLHQHVFDETNSRELLTACEMTVLVVELAFPFHICLLAQMS